MRVLDILHGTIVDGPGLRSSIYFAGCEHHCKGCHNPQSWNMNGGKEMTVNNIIAEISDNMFNVTLTGGDPLYQNLTDLQTLVEQIHNLGLNIWLYTGFTVEELQQNQQYKKLLSNIDILVDGPFEINKKNDNIQFRGSSNQRILKIYSTDNDTINYEDVSSQYDLDV